jgi:hypothetical protein
MVLRVLKTVFPIIFGIALLIVLLIVPVRNIPNVQNNVIAVQKIVGIDQVILGISTILMTLPAASVFLLKWNANTMDYLIRMYFIRYPCFN